MLHPNFIFKLCFIQPTDKNSAFKQINLQTGLKKNLFPASQVDEIKVVAFIWPKDI